MTHEELEESVPLYAAGALDRIERQALEAHLLSGCASCHSALKDYQSVAALLPPPRSNIHRMANAGRGPTVTIHTYGDPGTRATVFDVKAGTYETIDLRFHNLQEP